MKYVLIPVLNKVVSVDEMTVDFANLTITITTLGGLNYPLSFETQKDLIDKLNYINEGFNGKDITNWCMYNFLGLNQ